MKAVVVLAGLIVAADVRADDRLQAWLDDARISGDIPGLSAVVVADGAVCFAGGAGVADIETQRPMTADTPLYIGSVSKVWTAVLTLSLIEAGDLSMDDNIDWVARAPSDNPVSLEHLLTHTSGLQREGNFGYWFSAEFPDRGALRRWLATTSLRSAPGAALHYSNTGYAALGLWIEHAIDTPFEMALHERVLEPLGMESSGARGPAPGIANGYTPRGRIVPSAARPFAGVGPAIDGRNERQYHDARAMSPAFGGYSTARDMGRLSVFLLGHGHDELLSPESRAAMREVQAGGRGLGFRLDRIDGRDVARHDGWFAAHRTHLVLDAGAGIAVVVLANSDNASARDLATELYRQVYELETEPNDSRVSGCSANVEPDQRVSSPQAALAMWESRPARFSALTGDARQ